MKHQPHLVLLPRIPSRYGKLRYKPIVLAVVILAAAGCSGNRSAVNENNSFYKRGMQLRQDSRYKDAVDAFELCLKHSPKSYKAYLQLAMIYEDHLQQYSRAIVCYQNYIEMAPSSADQAAARTWLSRVKEKYYGELKAEYDNGPKSASRKPLSLIPQIGENFDDEHNHSSPTIAGPGVDNFDTTTSADSASPVQSDLENRIADTTSDTEKVGNVKNSTTFYSVQAGDTLSGIAQKTLGSQKYWKSIFEANKDVLSSPQELKIGVRLIIPDIDD